jgi:hypothetical protein
MASYKGNVFGGIAQDVPGTISLVTDAELPQPVTGTHDVVVDSAGVDRTISGWALYVSGGVVQAGESITCPPDSGPANREVPQIVRAVP